MKPRYRLYRSCLFQNEWIALPLDEKRRINHFKKGFHTPML